MICKIFVRTFLSVEECDMFEAVLQTEWPAVLQDPGLKAATIGVIFSAYRNKEAPYFSTVVWNFPDVNTQKVIEVLIEKHIKKIKQVLSPKTIAFTGARKVYLKT